VWSLTTTYSWRHTTLLWRHTVTSREATMTSELAAAVSWPINRHCQRTRTRTLTHSHCYGYLSWRGRFRPASANITTTTTTTRCSAAANWVDSVSFYDRSDPMMPKPLVYHSVWPTVRLFLSPLLAVCLSVRLFVVRVTVFPVRVASCVVRASVRSRVLAADRYFAAAIAAAAGLRKHRAC